MSHSPELFSNPNDFQKGLMNEVDSFIELGMMPDQIDVEIRRIHEDTAIRLFCLSYMNWMLKAMAEGFAFHVGADKDPIESTVTDPVTYITPEEGLYIHIDLELPDETGVIDVCVEASLSDMVKTREFPIDQEYVDLFRDGNRIHLEPFLLSDLAVDGEPIEEGTSLEIDLTKDGEVILNRSIAIHLPEEESGPSPEKDGTSLKERFLSQIRYPSHAEFAERIEDIFARDIVNQGRREKGLDPYLPVMHTAIIGNPGTGKRECASLLASAYYSCDCLDTDKVSTVRVPALVSSGKSDAYTDIVAAITNAQGGTLVVEGAHELARADYSNAEEEKVILKVLLDALTDKEQYPKWALILCGEPEGMDSLFSSFPELLHNLSKPIHLKDYTLDELYMTIDVCCKERDIRLTDEARKKVETYLHHLYSHRGLNFDNAKVVRRLFDETVIPAMFTRLSKEADPQEADSQLVVEADIPPVVATPAPALVELDGLVGLGKIKSRMKDYFNAVRLAGRRMEFGLPTVPPRLHMVFLGNPGTGKTTVAEIVGKVLASWGILSKGKVIRTEKNKMVGRYVGETEFKMNNLLAQAHGNVLFIDEAYQLVEGGDVDFGRIVMNSLLTELGKEKTDMVVILAGYTAPMKKLLESNEGIASRFPNVFNFEDYTTDELLEIGKQMVRRQGFVLTEGAEANLRAIIEEESDRPSPRFGNGRFVSNVIQNEILASMGARTANLENPTKEDLSVILPEDVVIGKARKDVVFDDAAIDSALSRLDDLSGLKNVKQAIHNFVQSARYLHSIGEPYVGKGLLSWRFIGRSGTGKSTVAEIMATILKGMRLISNSHITQIKGEQLLNASETECDRVLKEAVKKSCNGLIFIDVDDSQFAEARVYYGRTLDQIRLKIKELTVEAGGECALILAQLDAPNKNVAEQLSEGGIYEFDHTLIFKDFTSEELFEILCHCLRKFDVTFSQAAEKHMRDYLDALKSSTQTNARTMKLMARTIYQQVILRESGLQRPPKAHQVQLNDISNLKWNVSKGKIGFKQAER